MSVQSANAKSVDSTLTCSHPLPFNPSAWNPIIIVGLWIIEQWDKNVYQVIVESSHAYIISNDKLCRTTSLYHSSMKCFQKHVQLPGFLLQSVFDFEHERDSALPYQYDRKQINRSTYTFHELRFLQRDGGPIENSNFSDIILGAAQTSVVNFIDFVL